MAINYSKLLHILIDKNITTAQLAEKAGVSANIISRIKKNEYVSLDLCDWFWLFQLFEYTISKCSLEILYKRWKTA